MSGIIEYITQATEALSSLAEVMRDPAAVDFTSVREEFEQLEEAMKDKAAIDAAFAWLAQLNDAGRLVGSTHPVDYLVKNLGLTRSEAFSRLRQGRALFDPVEDPEPAPEEPEETTEQRRAREAEEQRRREAAEAAQKKAREEAARASSAARAMIERELKHLNQHAVPGAHELRQQALKRASLMPFHDLQAWLRQEIQRANAATRLPNGKKDPFAAHRKRSISFGQQDANGGVWVKAYLPAPMAAALRSALSYNAVTPTDSTERTEDKRNLPQKQVDKLYEIIKSHSADKEPNRGGIGSIVISATLDQLNYLDFDTLFDTSTGYQFTALELLSVGAATCDYFTAFDDQGRLLTVGRTRRTATLAQRIALFATEMVCSHPGCDRPIDECQAHHLVAWLLDGNTDIENLTLLCYVHHKHNNDYRDGRNNMGHAERDHLSGRAGWRKARGPDLEFNNTTAAQRAAARRLLKEREQASARIIDLPPSA